MSPISSPGKATYHLPCVSTPHALHTLALPPAPALPWPPGLLSSLSQTCSSLPQGCLSIYDTCPKELQPRTSHAPASVQMPPPQRGLPGPSHTGAPPPRPHHRPPNSLTGFLANRPAPIPGKSPPGTRTLSVMLAATPPGPGEGPSREQVCDRGSFQERINSTSQFTCCFRVPPTRNPHKPER